MIRYITSNIDNTTEAEHHYCDQIPSTTRVVGTLAILSGRNPEKKSLDRLLRLRLKSSDRAKR